jgi:acyl transferase domain-containing protein
VFLEIGPHSALAGPLRQIFTQASSQAPYVAAMARNQNCITSFLTAIGKLHSLRVDIDLNALFPTGTCLPDLPRYPWNHEDSYWYEPRVCKEWRHRKFPYHDLLGVKLPESTDLEPAWRNMFHLSNVPWVRDHKVGEDIVFPFAGYIGLAGEAIRQLTPEATEGFSIRNIRVNMALVLNEAKPTEMITSFRPHRLTNSLNSPWWEFTVASYNGHIWTKHCTGEVTALSADMGPGQDPEPLPRKLSAKKYYDTMSKGGLDLGPSFQTLDTIETSTNNDKRAIGNVINGRQGDEANYYIHPTVIDATIQILGAAAVSGYMRKTKNWLPTSIDKISIARCSGNMVTNVTADLSSNHSVVGGGRCTSDGRVVIEVDGLRMSLADGALSSEIMDTHAAARYEWDSDIDFLDVKELIRPPPSNRTEQLRLLEELGQLCLLSSKRRSKIKDSAAEIIVPHLQRYAGWVVSESKSAIASLASVLKSLDNETLAARIESVLARLLDTPAAAAATAIKRVYDGMDQLLSGDSLEDIVGAETLAEMHDFVEQANFSQFIRALGHSKPNVQILEIGNGKESIVRDIIKDLTRADGAILCAKYTFTSTGFISDKDHEQVFPNMEYATLDISQDLSEQGFDDRQYDLILATNVLHATKDLQASLANVKKLLRPDGRLVLRELCPSSKWVNYVLGLLPAWWIGVGDGRTEEPYISTDKWQSELAAAGLGGVEGLVLDAEAPHQLMATVIARHDAQKKQPSKKIAVLCGQEQSPVAKEILLQLEKKGYETTKYKLGDGPLPAGSDVVVSLLDLEKPFFESIDEARFQTFKEFLAGLEGRGVFWITHGSHLGCRDPRYAQVFGVARSVRSELVAEFATCEVDDFHDPRTAENIVRVLAKFQTRDADGTLNPDYEWAIRDGRVQVGRFYPFALRDELLISTPNEKAILDVATPGRVNSLHWVRTPREDLKPHEVEVQVHAAGLNFRVRLAT